LIGLNRQEQILGTRLAAILLWVATLGCGAFISGAVSAVTYPGPAAGSTAVPVVHRALVKLRSGASSNASGLASAGSVSPEWIDLGGRTQITIWSARALVGGLHVIELAPQNGAETLDVSLARLRADPAVEYAEADQRRHPMTIPDDPLFVATPGATGQWYLQAPVTTPASAATPAAVDAVDAWSITTGSAGLVIADIDNGVRFDHPDLLRAGDTNPGRLLPGYDFISNVTVGNEANGPNADASDPGDWVTQADTQTSLFSGCTVASSSWHGTRVSGVLGAITNNGVGIAGTTWAGWLLQARALGKCGGNDSDIETAMLWAAGVAQSGIPTNPYPARILNMSLGGTASCSQTTCPQTACPQSYQTIISELAQMGVLVVASAGNSGGPVATPANCPGVVAVAGLREDGTKVGYSNLGPGVTLGAPAGNCVNTSGACLYSIDTTYNLGLTTPAASSYTNQTNTNLGTSFSAPIVSGIAGLMLSVNANLTPAQLIARLESSAIAPFPVSSDSTVPMCHVPTSNSDYSQDAECNCTTTTCGAGMANALSAVNAALQPIVAIAPPSGGVTAGQHVVLSAASSAAACMYSISSYSWVIASGTGTIVSGANSNTVTVVAPSGGASFTLQLTVTDNAGRANMADVAVSSTAATTSAPASAGSTPCLTPITPAAPSYVAVAPSGPSVQAAGGTQQFTANVVNLGSSAVTWEVNGVAGGNTTNGTISTAGLYTAPADVPSSPTVTVTAVSNANSSVSGFAGVTITSPVTVAITPTSATVLVATGTQSFTATVSNSTNTAVTWTVNGIAGGNATVGTISSAGLYTAPAQIPSPATVTVSAVPVADQAVSASAVVTVAHVGVAVTPSSATLAVLNTQSFTATVTNTQNTAVSWQVNGIAGGNATVGTVTSAGLYTAPAVIPSPATVTVKAVSAADPTQSGSASVTIAPVSVSISPAVATLPVLGTQPFVATVLYSSNTAVTWQVNAVAGGNASVGTVSSSGVYTAPASVPSPAAVTVTAVSVAQPSQSGSATVTVTAAASSSGSSSSGGGGGGHSGGGAFDVWSLVALSVAIAMRRRSPRLKPRSC
jgi:serine protease